MSCKAAISRTGKNARASFVLALVLALGLAPGAGAAPSDESEPAKKASFFQRNKTAVTLMGIEAAGTLLASSGYIAERIDRGPAAGAEFTGGTYLGLGGTGLAFSFIVLLDPDLTPAGRNAWFTAIGGLIALGAYDLSRAKESPTSSEVFRDNMIGINAIVIATAAARWMGRRTAR